MVTFLCDMVGAPYYGTADLSVFAAISSVDDNAVMAIVGYFRAYMEVSFCSNEEFIQYSLTKYSLEEVDINILYKIRNRIMYKSLLLPTWNNKREILAVLKVQGRFKNLNRYAMDRHQHQFHAMIYKKSIPLFSQTI